MFIVFMSLVYGFLSHASANSALLVGEWQSDCFTEPQKTGGSKSTLYFYKNGQIRDTHSFYNDSECAGSFYSHEYNGTYRLVGGFERELTVDLFIEPMSVFDLIEKRVTLEFSGTKKFKMTLVSAKRADFYGPQDLTPEEVSDFVPADFYKQ